MSMLNPSSFVLNIHTNVEDQVTRCFKLSDWDLGSAFKDIKGNLKGFRLPVDRIHLKSVTSILVKLLSMSNRGWKFNSMFVGDSVYPFVNTSYDSISTTKIVKYPPLEGMLNIDSFLNSEAYSFQRKRFFETV